MNTDQQLPRPYESAEISEMLDRLVKEFGFADPQAAIKLALASLIEDLELPDQDSDNCLGELREALADIDDGDRGQPASEVFAEIRREFKSSSDV